MGSGQDAPPTGCDGVGVGCPSYGMRWGRGRMPLLRDAMGSGGCGMRCPSYGMRWGGGRMPLLRDAMGSGQDAPPTGCDGVGVGCPSYGMRWGRGRMPLLRDAMGSGEDALPTLMEETNQGLHVGCICPNFNAINFASSETFPAVFSRLLV